MAIKSKKSSAFHHLKKVVAKHHKLAHDSLHATHKKAHKILRKHGRTIDEIRVKGALVASTAAVTSMLATAPAALAEKPAQEALEINQQAQAQQVETPAEPVIPKAKSRAAFAKDLRSILGNKSRPTPTDEEAIGEAISGYFNMSAHAELQGNRLNKVFGLIGGEQHMPRYPGDTAVSHYTEGEDIYPNLSGITPGRSAWGYFAPSKSALTEDLILKERYYIAAQTFLSPGWGTRTNELYAWFKHRKVVIVNTNTGQACVAVIGDAGPAEWTGKSFGGSPEVMIHVGYSTGSRRGPVLIYFVDDPDNKIPLGKIKAK